MASSYTHHLVAAHVLQALDAPLQRKLSPYLSLYFFGAQGADFCFFCPLVDGAKKPVNFGSYLHRYGGFSAFSVCKLFSETDDAIFAYSLGYITHYAADVVFHPFVYANAGKSPLRHSRIERALDVYLSRTLPSTETYPQFYAKKPSEQHRRSLFLLYAAFAAANRLPTLKKRTFYRAFSLFNAYLPRISSISKEKNMRLITALCNVENSEWANPALPSMKSNDGGLELFKKSVDSALYAIAQFDTAIKNKTALPFAVFGKNYLSGL
jgi:hypothetical protein